MPVLGQVSHVQPWCQGAAPPDGVGTVESPYRGEVFLRPGSENSEAPPVAQLDLDEHGAFALDLPPGRYCAQTGDRMDSLAERLETAQAHPAPFGLDLACVEREWRRCRGVLDVSEQGATGLTIRIVDRCGWAMPCALHPPAPPPSAAPRD